MKTNKQTTIELLNKFLEAEDIKKNSETEIEMI